MLKKILIVLGLIILVGAILVFFMRGEVDAPSTSEDRENHQTTTTSTESQDTDSGDSEEAVPATTIDIHNFAYSPQTITVKKGSTVTWTNQDADRHDITPDEESDAFKGSELLSRNKSYSFTFNTVGTYTYHCSPHPYMKGTVIVTE